MSSKPDISAIKKFSESIFQNLDRVIIGKHAVLEQTLVCLLCQGHLLIEDVPGVGKTMLARALAISMGGTFNRLQFTPDMLPSDVTGVSIYNQNSHTFEFRPGPLFSQVVLVDEINRATPKTQSALLEAMEERQATVDGVTHILPTPFMVMGTQNPIEYEGTFPLPEAQLDRFLMRVSLGYPTMLDEIKVLESQNIKHPIEMINAVVDEKQVLTIQEYIKFVYVAPSVKRYCVELVRATRENKDVYLGASPRGSLGLYRCGQAMAAIKGRNYVIPDDIKAVSIPVLSHRILLNPAARLHNMTTDQVVEEALGLVPVPTSNLEPMTGEK
jgi:MoxR-like ATPase